MEEIKNLPLSKIEASVLNPRKIYNKEAIKDLASSIKTKGLLQPIIVRASSVDDRYDIVCGQRRMHASLEAGLTTIPAIVRDLTDFEAMEYRSIENLQREDLNAIDEAQGFADMMSTCNYKILDLVARLDKSQKYITSRLKLLTLSMPVRDAIVADLISPAHGVVIARLPEADSQVSLMKSIITKKLSVKAAENALSKHGRELAAAPFDVSSCGRCRYNGKKQTDLFDSDTKLEGRCMNAKCFDARVRALGPKKKDVISQKADNEPQIREIVDRVHKDTDHTYMRTLAQALLEMAPMAVKLNFMKRRNPTLRKESADTAIRIYFRKLELLFIPGFCVEMTLLMQPEADIIIKSYQKHYGIKAKKSGSVVKKKETVSLEADQQEPEKPVSIREAKSKHGDRITISGGDISEEAAQGLADILGCEQNEKQSNRKARKVKKENKRLKL